MHEHVFAAFIALDEAEAFAGVEELDRAGTFANDLGRHAAATAAAAGSAAAEAAAPATSTAAEAAAITAAKAAARAAEAATIATTSEAVAATKAVTTATRERIETVFAEPVALVAATAATSSIKTHKPERTFVSSAVSQPKPRGRNAPGRQA
ncbi:hypothetical protein GCM10023306_07960 [Novosphingobium ginsenosidimutans]